MADQYLERHARAALFDGIEEGGIRASSSFEIDEHENERAIEGLQDRVSLLKRISGDIHEEVDNHNRMLDGMRDEMDTSRGVLAGTMDKFKMVFETKSSRRMGMLVASFLRVVLHAVPGSLFKRAHLTLSSYLRSICRKESKSRDNHLMDDYKESKSMGQSSDS
ncbi:OLC1v1007087C1 [Oldenlandia corymbosa var. corymbosa]|uniref:OLC1v1007087C1 n=1 Tax=Oldenlandia corymbosa var. corymbosa TaxID=529605 RepID=A0AAV1DIK1_OLDCO|nr:OLC1v1007087C1 [Oldenlandia corymbosa var. corymbosa]